MSEYIWLWKEAFKLNAFVDICGCRRCTLHCTLHCTSQNTTKAAAPFRKGSTHIIMAATLWGVSANLNWAATLWGMRPTWIEQPPFVGWAPNWNVQPLFTGRAYNRFPTTCFFSSNFSLLHTYVFNKILYVTGHSAGTLRANPETESNSPAACSGHDMSIFRKKSTSDQKICSYMSTFSKKPKRDKTSFLR